MWIPVELLWAYLLAITLLTLTPGVDTLLVMRNTGRGGLGDGFVTSLGICCGLFIHATLSALGISILLVETAWAFTVLKWAGAIYLIWLGIMSFRQAMSRRGSSQQEALPEQSDASGGVSGKVAFREGLLSNLLNPKTALFYMALLPQFIDPAGSAFLQSMFLAGLHFVIAMIWQCTVAGLILKSSQLEVGQGVKRALSGLTGGFFVAIGLKLGLDGPA
ncbi:LysE family translocator [Marinobacter sp. CHS3-4]|uniref:LysE family translocator n=1 Tax=Marinobacter sp. CHS3-4 TaxID=3045174 RepID=UPI0024B4EEDD|nr:LysE family translocator [Marinobacter sp. CHS3-4]MDI9246004.1 LysE family translocator [Marinobacter sp. CHS3-4]